MTGFKFTLPITLTLIAIMLTSVGIASAQEEPRSLAPSGLSAEICEGSICLSWTPGTDTYTFQEIQFLENGDHVSISIGRWITSPDASEASIPFAFLTLHSGKRTSLNSPNAGSSYTFQVVGVKGSFFNREYSGFSNKVTLDVPVPRTEPFPMQPPADNDPSTPQPTPTPEATPTPEETPTPEQPAPSGLTAAQDEGAVNLSWTPGNSPDYVSQAVLRREAVKGTKLEVIHTFSRDAEGMNTGSYTDDTVESGKRYIYRIRALKSNGKGPMSNAVRITVQ